MRREPLNNADERAAFLVRSGDVDVVGPEEQRGRSIRLIVGVERKHAIIEKDMAFVDRHRQRA